MAEKISVYVYVPGLNVTHNFLVPDDMAMAKVVDLVVEILGDEYPGAPSSGRLSRHFFLKGDTGEALKEGCSLKQYGAVNGEHLVLV